MNALIEKLIARRVRKGYARLQSETLLNDLIVSHNGDNLAHALAYNGFATNNGAAAAVTDLNKFMGVAAK